MQFPLQPEQPPFFLSFHSDQTASATTARITAITMISPIAYTFAKVFVFISL